MNVIVFDLELNQPSGRIIEIGAVMGSIITGKIESQFQIFANPREEISADITQLTGITDDMVKQSASSAGASCVFREWCGTQPCGYRLASWGTDYRRFPNLIDDYSLWDVKEFMSVFRHANGAKAKGGLVQTLNAFAMPFSGVPHRAESDAYNTFRLLHYGYVTLRHAYDAAKLPKLPDLHFTPTRR